MKNFRLNGFFDWLKRSAVPIDGVEINRRPDPPEDAEAEQERDVVAPRVEPLPPGPVRWGNFR
jgi:hypothetical protein